MAAYRYAAAAATRVRSRRCLSLSRARPSLFILGAAIASAGQCADAYQVYGHVSGEQEPLALENALWANTVLASGIACGVVIYTGRETRSAMNSSSKPPSKMWALAIASNVLLATAADAAEHTHPALS